MSFLKSFLICISMYSVIPVPQVKWDDKNMKYIFYFLAVIGILLGLMEYLIYQISLYLGFSGVLYAALSTAAIILFTGGIHMDGYADTIDAIFCHGDMEKRRQVLSDAHTGAFAVIYTIIYFLMLFAGFENMFAENLHVFIFVFIFAVSRILSLFLIAVVPSSSKSGLLYVFSSKENKKSLLIYAFILLSVLIFSACIFLGCKTVLILLLILILISIILIRYFSKVFGGLSGDLAGFSICIYEVITLLFFSISRQAIWN